MSRRRLFQNNEGAVKILPAHAAPADAKDAPMVKTTLCFSNTAYTPRTTKTNRI